MNFVIRNKYRENLDYTLNPAPKNSSFSEWIVILGHGVTGNKERPVISDTAKALNEGGFATLHFSFSGNGKSEGNFVDSTISKEVEDLDAVITSVENEYKNIAYVGHSMGGAVGIIKAATDNRIKALVSLAGMVDTKQFAKTEFGNETPDAGLMWDDKDCPLSSQFMDDLCLSLRSVLPQARSINIPWLLFHGTADDVVNPSDTKSILNLNKPNATAVFVEGADHSFNEVDHKTEVHSKLIDWLSKLVK